VTERVPLLLHSLADMRELWLPLLGAAGVRSVTEVGAETGVVTRLLAGWLGERGGGRLVTVDPGAPGVPADELPSGVELDVVRDYSPEALRDLDGTDAWLLDGDHNYHVVTQELSEIERLHGGPEDLFPLVLMNDVAWPSGRRDQYYDPSRLPPEAVRPHTFAAGVRPGLAGVDPRGGFHGKGEFAVALEEGGPRNGVLTAVEEFLATRPHLELSVVTSVFGLGVVIDGRQPWAAGVTGLIAPFAASPFLERLEANRVELYLRVLDLQDTVAAVERERLALHARLAAVRSAMRSESLLAAIGAVQPPWPDGGDPDGADPAAPAVRTQGGSHIAGSGGAALTA